MLRRAYAKINIGLHVLGRRTDGYHSLATIYAPLELHDELWIEEAQELSVQMQPSLGVREEDNLAYRAARALERATGTATGAKITIIKHIPVGSGLGGGSSDAATTLHALQELWHCNVSDEQLASIALELGSDVPFFLHPRLSYAEGRGEELTALPPLPQRHVLIVVPPFAISTAWAYSMLKRHAEYERPRLLRDALSVSVLSDELLRQICTNDFEEVVFSHCPALAHVKEILYQRGATYASLTGTGAAVFGFFPTEDQALYAATAFSESYRPIVTRTLQHNEHSHHRG